MVQLQLKFYCLVFSESPVRHLISRMEKSLCQNNGPFSYSYWLNLQEEFRKSPLSILIALIHYFLGIMVLLYTVQQECTQSSIYLPFHYKEFWVWSQVLYRTCFTHKYTPILLWNSLTHSQLVLIYCILHRIIGCSQVSDHNVLNCGLLGMPMRLASIWLILLFFQLVIQWTHFLLSIQRDLYVEAQTRSNDGP